jgi:hypothetical protein
VLECELIRMAVLHTSPKSEDPAEVVAAGAKRYQRLAMFGVVCMMATWTKCCIDISKE